MINTQIRQFRDSIIAITNASPLPIEVKRLVFSEVRNLIEAEADRAIAEENKMQEQESTKTEND